MEPCMTKRWTTGTKPVCPTCGKPNFCNEHMYRNRQWWDEYKRCICSWNEKQF